MVKGLDDLRLQRKRDNTTYILGKGNNKRRTKKGKVSGDIAVQDKNAKSKGGGILRYLSQGGKVEIQAKFTVIQSTLKHSIKPGESC